MIIIDENKLEDGFYFISWPTKDDKCKEIISIIAIFNDKNEVSFIGDSKSETIGGLVDLIKTEKLQIISKIQLPK